MASDFYEVGERLEDFKDLLQSLRGFIDSGDVDGLCFVIRNRQGEIIHWHLKGTASMLEWAGIMELMKIHYLDGSSE